MTHSEQITKWLEAHELISRNQLEKICGMPQGCIYKAIVGRISLPEKHIIPLANQLRPYGFKLK